MFVGMVWFGLVVVELSLSPLPSLPFHSFPLTLPFFLSFFLINGLMLSLFTSIFYHVLNSFLITFSFTFPFTFAFSNCLSFYEHFVQCSMLSVVLLVVGVPSHLPFLPSLHSFTSPVEFCNCHLAHHHCTVYLLINHSDDLIVVHSFCLLCIYYYLLTLFLFVCDCHFCLCLCLFLCSYFILSTSYYLHLSHIALSCRMSIEE